MFRCDVCGVVFDRPAVRTETNRDAQFVWQERFELCPVCGESHFSPVDKCDCGRWKEQDAPLCSHCRKILLKKLYDFADYLSEAEEDQLDHWLDGNSIKDRREWK